LEHIVVSEKNAEKLIQTAGIRSSISLFWHSPILKKYHLIIDFSRFTTLSFPRIHCMVSLPLPGTMRAGAAQPCQVRKEATVSGCLLRRDPPGKGTFVCGGGWHEFLYNNRLFVTCSGIYRK